MMPAAPENVDAHDHSDRIRRHLPHNPAQALKMLPSLGCRNKRRRLAAIIAQSWARQDINSAWDAVARSSLRATGKHIMFNGLWG